MESGMISDWKDVYRQERKGPGYVIEDGRSPRVRGCSIADVKPMSQSMAVAFIRAGLALQGTNPLVGDNRNHY